MANDNALSLVLGDPPDWAGGTFRRKGGLAGKEWLTIAEAITWFYRGVAIPLWRWPSDLCGLPDHLHAPEARYSFYYLYRSCGSGGSVIAAANQVELFRHMLAANDNATVRPSIAAYDPRRNWIGQFLEAARRGDRSVTDAFDDMFERACGIETGLLTVENMLRKAVGGGHIRARGTDCRSNRRSTGDTVQELPPWRFGDRSWMTPCDSLFHDTDGHLAIGLRLEAKGVLKLAPEGPIREVEPCFLEILPWVRERQRAENWKARRAAGGRPTMAAHDVYRNLYDRLLTSNRIRSTDSPASIVRKLQDVASRLNIKDRPADSTVAKWHKKRWRQT